ncbi:DUF4097 domain-containing protein [Ilyomonas limi]|uniref:DUF4097 domain-containing protein n=1 Tax=Ilyomonas limi TaxID=2575867 RepID=A0A4U3KS68_9BACT|nr:DUF4097 family beta strand repeat-containing protein [Ilyomonas limi]TKK65121.1 DUF4097 domain-containing protein [Ilyomonas limi]
MKNITFIILFCLLSCCNYAQKIIEQHLNYAAGEKIRMNIQIADSIRIRSWNKNEVYAKAAVNINDNKDNEVYKTTFDASGNSINITAKFDEQKSRQGGDSCHCNYHSNIYWDVYVPEGAELSVETINGNIIIEGKTAAINAHSISGFIDLQFAGSRKADLKMSTISGTIYTDLAINNTRHDKGGNAVSYQYNGGGDNVELETISGDIYVRKQE